MNVKEEKPITVILPKGRLLEESLNYFRLYGVKIPSVLSDTRKCLIESLDYKFKFVLVKPNDVIKLIKLGIGQIGIVGKDLLLEYNQDFFNVVELDFGVCELCVCGKVKSNLENVKVVASKYPYTSKKFFEKRGKNIQVLKLHGSVEVAPLLNIADCIVEIVQSGKTLSENGLIVYEKIENISACLITGKNIAIDRLFKKETLA